MTEESFVQFKLRLPESMRNRLELACAESGRSMSAEILFRLDSTLPKTEADLRLRDLRTAAWAIEASYDFQRAELAALKRKLASMDKDDPARGSYISEIASSETRLNTIAARRELALLDLARATAAPLDQK